MSDEQKETIIYLRPSDLEQLFSETVAFAYQLRSLGVSLEDAKKATIKAFSNAHKTVYGEKV